MSQINGIARGLKAVGNKVDRTLNGRQKCTVVLQGSSFPFHAVRGLDQGPTIFTPTIAMWRYAFFWPFLFESAVLGQKRAWAADSASEQRGPAAIFSPLVRRRIRVRWFVRISYVSSLNPGLVQMSRPLHRRNENAVSVHFYELLFRREFLLAIKRNAEISY